MDAQVTQYESAIAGKAYRVLTPSGVFQLEGESRFDFVQRQTTNDIRRISETGYIRTVLTSPSARILDVWYAYAANDSIRALTQPGLTEGTIRFLKSKVFFMDKVSITDISGDVCVIELFDGDHRVARHLTGDGNLGQGQVRQIEHKDSSLHVLATREGKTLLIGDRAAQAAIVASLSVMGLAEIDSAVAEIVRVESGLPQYPNELNEDYTPLEAGLLDTISDTKGCYTGQEVIARQITYDKVTKQLKRIALSEPTQRGETIFADEKRAGSITSVVQSPKYGLIGLAYIYKDYLDGGQILRTAEGVTVSLRG